MRSFEKKPAMLLPLVISFNQFFACEVKLKLFSFLSVTIYASLKFCHLLEVENVANMTKIKQGKCLKKIAAGFLEENYEGLLRLIAPFCLILALGTSTSNGSVFKVAVR